MEKTKPIAAVADAQSVVRNHLRAFLEQKGVDAILEDYHDDARFHTEQRVFRGKHEIREFVTGFLGSLPAGATQSFSLRAFRVDGDLAFIAWSVGREIPLGTDTFLVRDGRILTQTCAMHVGR